MPRREHRVALYREHLQRLDITEAVTGLAMRYVTEIGASGVVATPDDDENPLDVIGDVVGQVPHLIARIRELEAQLEQHQHVQRGPLQDSWRRVTPPATEELSQVPEEWEG